MDSSLLTLLSTPGGVMSSILVGIVTNALWEWLRDTVSFPSPNYIPIRGRWRAETTYRHADGRVEQLVENLEIQQQFGRRFKGLLDSPHPDKPHERIVLKVRGEFMDKFHAIFWYQQRSNALTDMGAGVLQFEANHGVAKGGSANFGVTSGWETANTTFVLCKV